MTKESEVIIKKKELEKRYEALEVECSTARADLKLAVKRIEDLQSAIQGDLDDSISDNSERYYFNSMRDINLGNYLCFYSIAVNLTHTAQTTL